MTSIKDSDKQLENPDFLRHLMQTYSPNVDLRITRRLPLLCQVVSIIFCKIELR